MKKATALFALAIVAISSAAFADDIKIDDALPNEDATQVFCPLEGYKSFQIPVVPGLAVPDNNATGVSTSFIVPTDGTSIDDVIIDLSMSHSWVGDLIANVFLDVDNNGTNDFGPVSVICRQNRSTCVGLGSPFGCSADLVAANVYEFSDAGAAQLGEPLCTTPAAGACYRPSENNAALAVFDGKPKGGRWTLQVSDNAGGDTGTLLGWSIHILNRSNATENSSWGNVKALYN